MAFQDAFSDVLALSQDMFISGGIITTTPLGTDTQYDITAGHVFYKGELMPVDAQTIVQASTQVIFLELVDEGVDAIPVQNIVFGSEEVMRHRRVQLAVANVYPTDYMSLTAPKKADLELLKYKGRIAMRGAIMPYYGDMSYFSATGLGLGGTIMDGWAICNGLNGTPDLRGTTLMEATNVPSSGGGSAAHPGVANTSNVGDQVGADGVVLNAQNLPEHTHDYIDEAVGGAGTTEVQAGSSYARPGTTKTTEPNTTTNDPVDVRQASFALTFIMSIV